MKKHFQSVILVLYVLTFGQAATEKFVGGGVPSWFTEQFLNTFLNFTDGALDVAFYSIALFETLLAVIFSTALVQNVFSKNSTVTARLGFLLGSVLFLGLGFGMRLTHKYADAASLFFYCTITYFVFLSFPQTPETAKDHLSGAKDF